jgi:hypothetical protein
LEGVLFRVAGRKGRMYLVIVRVVPDLAKAGLRLRRRRCRCRCRRREERRPRERERSQRGKKEGAARSKIDHDSYGLY